MTKLKKALTLYGLTMIAIGSCVGIGIFLTPASVASALPSSSQMLMVWTVGGIVALTGALTFAELGGIFSESGGVYIYLKEAYGEIVAFLYGWSILTVITSGAIASLALGFARYVGHLIPLSDFGMTLVAISSIVLVTLINVRGVKFSEYLASSFTTMKLLGILFIIVIGFMGYFSWSSFTPDFTVEIPKSTSFATALVSVLFSFGGWHHASYLAGETINPQRSIPKAMMMGTLVVTLVYLLINLAFIFLLPMEQIVGSKAIAADAIGGFFSWGGSFIAILIILSTFGTIGIFTMSAPRIYFAMSKDKVFFNFLGKLHPKWGTPLNAIVFQSVWAIVLILFWQTFESLIKYVVFMDWIFMTLAAASIFVFRKKLPTVDRPYKTIGYPIIPLIFIVISIWFLVFTLVGKSDEPIAGLGVTAVGLLFYFIFKATQKNTPKEG